MNAELRRNREVAHFHWDPQDTFDRVTVFELNFAGRGIPRHEKTYRFDQARAYWTGLVEMGFKRVF